MSKPQPSKSTAPPPNKADASTQAASGAGAAETTEKPKRSRAALSTVKRLAIAVAAIVSASAGKAITGPLGDAIAAAKVIADEVNANSLKPIEDRLAALTTEIGVAATGENLSKPGGALALHKLTQEMQRLENRRKALVEKGTATTE